MPPFPSNHALPTCLSFSFHHMCLILCWGLSVASAEHDVSHSPRESNAPPLWEEPTESNLRWRTSLERRTDAMCAHKCQDELKFPRSVTETPRAHLWTWHPRPEPNWTFWRPHPVCPTALCSAGHILGWVSSHHPTSPREQWGCEDTLLQQISPDLSWLPSAPWCLGTSKKPWTLSVQINSSNAVAPQRPQSCIDVFQTAEV